MRYERDESASLELGADVRRVLRHIYAPPVGERYWNGLESRIMARVALRTTEWWSFFGGWTRVGLLAAGLTGLIAGLVAYRGHAEARRLAYRSILEAPESVRAEVESAVVPGGASTREATLRYVFSH